MHYLILSLTASLSVAMMLFSASFKIRFGIAEVFATYLPAILLAGSAVFANVMFPRMVVSRLKLASLFLLLAAISLYTFALGGLNEFLILERILINCALGFFIIMFPWNKQSTDQLMLFLMIFGCILSLNTLMVYESLGERTGYDDEVREGYLNITLATAFGCIAALHRIIERIDPISVIAFMICWVGIALSLGRGSLIFCALVSIIYALTAFTLKITTMGKLKKIVLGVLIVSMIPVVVVQLMSVERTAKRMLVLFTDSDSSAGVQGRITQYEAAINTISDAPIFGNGLGAYHGDAVSSIGYPHNIILQYAVDGGLIGVSALTLFLLIICACFIKAMKLGNPKTRNTTLACGALFLLMLLSYMKSHDAYRGLEMFILSAMPPAAYLSSRMELSMRRKSRRRHRSRRTRHRSHLQTLNG